jgi:hypothetical protein
MVNLDFMLDSVPMYGGYSVSREEGKRSHGT